MTDFDAATALLMLSNGYDFVKTTAQVKSENSFHYSVPPEPMMVAHGGREKLRGVKFRNSRPYHHLLATPSSKMASHLFGGSPCSETSDRMSSPEFLGWDKSRTSSPITVQQAVAVQPQLYASSPGMDGFMALLKPGHEHSYASTPVKNASGGLVVVEPEQQLVPEDLTKNGATAAKVAIKTLHSPSDSGNSSIHDDNAVVQHPVTLLQPWPSKNAEDELPNVVAELLARIVRESAYRKEQYTKLKMAQFPLECEYNPNKSRLRKECHSAGEAADRAKNNLASRRSRYKKKLGNQLMNINLDYDRTENRQLFLQQEWLASVIENLEQQAQQHGADADVLRRLRGKCGL